MAPLIWAKARLRAIPAQRRCTITSNQPESPGKPTTPPNTASWAYAEGWLEDDEHIRAARRKAVELDCTPVTRSTAAVLRLLATAINALTVVEVGTGTGVSAAALLSGMAPDSILTSIDIEAENQRVARDTLTELGYDHVRARLIAGRALDVLPRLTDQAYDLVFVDGDKAEYPAILQQARRLLRVGGILAFDNVLSNGRVADPGQRDAETAALRDVAHALRDDEHWVPALMTIGDGLLAAVLRGEMQ